MAREFGGFNLFETWPMRFGPEYEFVGSGGEQLVGRLSETMPGKLIKISHRALGAMPYNEHQSNPYSPRPVTQNDYRLYQAAQLELLILQERRQVLQTYFKPENLVSETTKLGFVALNGRQRRTILGKADTPDAEARWYLTRVRHQNIVPALIDRSAFATHDIHAFQAETHGTFSNNEYIAANRLLIERPWRPANYETLRLLRAVQGNESLNNILSNLDNPQYRAELGDFITRAIAFMADTGEHIDLGGKGNVILFRQNEQWQYLLVDAQSDSNVSWIADTERSFRALSVDGRPFTTELAEATLNTFKLIRTLNGLAALLELNARVDIAKGYTLGDREWVHIREACASFGAARL